MRKVEVSSKSVAPLLEGRKLEATVEGHGLPINTMEPCHLADGGKVFAVAKPRFIREWLAKDGRKKTTIEFSEVSHEQ